MAMHPTARSLILDLLSTLRRGTMPVRALVEAGALLGIEENNIRVSLARLYASHRIERDESYIELLRNTVGEFVREMLEKRQQLKEIN